MLVPPGDWWLRPRAPFWGLQTCVVIPFVSRHAAALPANKDPQTHTLINLSSRGGLTVNIHSLRKFIPAFLFVSLFLLSVDSFARRRPPAGGRGAIVVGGGLSALRAEPELSGTFIGRKGLGPFLAGDAAEQGRGV